VLELEFKAAASQHSHDHIMHTALVIQAAAERGENGSAYRLALAVLSLSRWPARPTAPLPPIQEK